MGISQYSQQRPTNRFTISSYVLLSIYLFSPVPLSIKAANLRDKLKSMIGGGQIDEEVIRYTGADAYGLDAMDAVLLTKGWIGGN